MVKIKPRKKISYPKNNEDDRIGRKRNIKRLNNKNGKKKKISKANNIKNNPKNKNKIFQKKGLKK